MSRKPIILIVPAIACSTTSRIDHSYSLRRNYADAIAELGGFPLIVPYQTDAIDMALDLCDGVMVSGSNPGEDIEPDRLSFEKALVLAAVEMGIPLLGICHGMQLIGQVLGGTRGLINGSGTVTTGADLHCPFDIPDRPAHGVDIADGSLLKAVLGVDRIQTNSFHRHQLLGPGNFTVAARSSDDGVIEVIEGNTKAICLGIQWHPEFLLTPEDRAILQCFVDACRSGSASRHVPDSHLN